MCETKVHSQPFVCRHDLPGTREVFCCNVEVGSLNSDASDRTVVVRTKSKIGLRLPSSLWAVLDEPITVGKTLLFRRLSAGEGIAPFVNGDWDLGLISICRRLSGDN